MTIGIRLSVLFFKKGNCKLWNWCAFKHTDRAGGEPKKRDNFMVVAKTLDYTQAGKVTSLEFRAKGDLLHGVSAVPVRSSVKTKWWKIVNKFQLLRVAASFVKEREKVTLWGLHNRMEKTVEVRMLYRTSNLEAVQIFLELMLNLRKKALESQRHRCSGM